MIVDLDKYTYHCDFCRKETETFRVKIIPTKKGDVRIIPKCPVCSTPLVKRRRGKNAGQRKA